MKKSINIIIDVILGIMKVKFVHKYCLEDEIGFLWHFRTYYLMKYSFWSVFAYYSGEVFKYNIERSLYVKVTEEPMNLII